MAYHPMDCVVNSMEQAMALEIVKDAKIGDSSDENLNFTRPRGWLMVKLLHSFMSSLKYGLGLMLMLIAMTFNPSLFLALMIGYLIGDYICCDFRLNKKINKSKEVGVVDNWDCCNPSDAPTGPIGYKSDRKIDYDEKVAQRAIHAILCLPKEENEYEAIRYSN